MDQPLLPDSEEAADSPLPLAYVYRTAPSAMQSAVVQKAQRVLEFEPSERREIEPLMGWISIRDPFGSMSRLYFPNRPKSYVDNFR